MSNSSLLFDLVSIYSPSEHEDMAADYLVTWMQANNFRAFRDKVGNAIGIRGDENAPHTLILLGHIDTVSGEIPVRIENGCLYGRGSVDAKGSLCAFADATAQAHLPADWRIIVIGAVEEEIATSKGAYHIRENYTPDYCIIGEPSGAERITLGYKGRLLVDYTLIRPLAHTARAEPSVGALGAEFWQAIVNWSQAINQSRERYFDQLMIHLRQINTESDGFQETVKLTVGFRLPCDYTPDAVFEVVAAFAPTDAQLRAYSAEHTYQGNKNNPLVRQFLAAIRAQQKQPAFVLKTGTSDMNVVGANWTCPIIAYGPGDSNLDHTPHENLPLGEYEQAITTLRYFIENLK